MEFAIPWLYDQLSPSPYGGRECIAGHGSRGEIINYFKAKECYAIPAVADNRFLGKVADFMWNGKEILVYSTPVTNVIGSTVYKIVVRYPEHPHRCG